MILDYEPGDKVTNPNNKDWGIGQVQSIIRDKVTVNFENAGKKVINAKNVELKRIKYSCVVLYSSEFYVLSYLEHFGTI